MTVTEQETAQGAGRGAAQETEQKTRQDGTAPGATPSTSENKSRRKGWQSTVWRRLRAPAALLILGVVVHKFGTSALVGALERIDAQAVVLTFVFSVPATVLSAWRWRLVAGRLGIELPLRTAVADYYQAMFLNATLPSGVLGDVHRAVRNGRDTGDVGRGVRAVILERTAGQVVIVGAGVVVLAVATPPLPVLSALEMPLAAAGAAVCAVAAVVGAVLASRRSRRCAKLRRDLGVFAADARSALLAQGSWRGVLATSVLALCGHLGLFLASARVAGSSAPLTALVPPLLLALLVMALPVNVGGWGPREGMCALAFGAAGLGAAQGLASAVVYGALALLSAVPGAAVLGWRIVAARRERRAADAAGAGGAAGTAGAAGAASAALDVVGPAAGAVSVPQTPEVELEEHVRAEGEAAGAGPEGLPHPFGPWEAEPRHAVAEEYRRDRHVQPVQRRRPQKAGHRRPAALDKYPAQAAAGQGLQH